MSTINVSSFLKSLRSLQNGRRLFRHD